MKRTQNHAGSGHSSRCNANNQHQMGTADTAYLRTHATIVQSPHAARKREKRLVIVTLKSQPVPKKHMALKFSPFVLSSRGAGRALSSWRSTRAAGGAQEGTFSKNVGIGRLEELDVVLHAAVGALRLLQAIL